MTLRTSVTWPLVRDLDAPRISKVIGDDCLPPAGAHDPVRVTHHELESFSAATRRIQERSDDVRLLDASATVKPRDGISVDQALERVAIADVDRRLVCAEEGDQLAVGLLPRVSRGSARPP